MIRIEFFSEDNIEEVLELEKLCFPDDPWGRLSFENELSNPLSVFIIAIDEEENKIIGYGGVWLMYDVGNITNIATHPHYRREGIGTKILSVLTDVCTEKGMESITLEVRAGNIPAQAMYQANGFSLCGRRKNYYRDKEDALIMTKVLTIK